MTTTPGMTSKDLDEELRRGGWRMSPLRLSRLAYGISSEVTRLEIAALAQELQLLRARNPGRLDLTEPRLEPPKESPLVDPPATLRVHFVLTVCFGEVKLVLDPSLPDADYAAAARWLNRNRDGEMRGVEMALRSIGEGHRGEPVTYSALEEISVTLQREILRIWAHHPEPIEVRVSPAPIVR